MQMAMRREVPKSAQSRAEPGEKRQNLQPFLLLTRSAAL